MVAAMKCHRNSIGIEIDRDYCRMAANRLKKENQDLFSNANLEFRKQINSKTQGIIIREERMMYKTRRSI